MQESTVDPALEWLIRPSLELHAIVNLASGHSADAPLRDERHIRRRALKAAINGRRLPAVPRGTPASKNSVISLKDLWSFLIEGPHQDDPAFEYLRPFCQRWAAVRGDDLPQSATPKRALGISPREICTTGIGSASRLGWQASSTRHATTI
jgi:hypothetical protein